MIDPSEAYRDLDAFNTVLNNKRDLCFLTLRTIDKNHINYIISKVKENNLKVTQVKGNPNFAIIIYRSKAEDKAKRLKQIAEKYGGYLSYEATADETREIGYLLGYDKEKVDQYVRDRY